MSTPPINPIKIYVAASFPRQPDARDLRIKLQNAGFLVTSRWMDVSEPYPPQRTCAYTDLEDMQDANVLVQITGDKQSSGGRHSEYGYFMARDKLIVIIGPREQVFHHIDEVVVTNTTDEAISAIRSFQVHQKLLERAAI